MKKLSYLFILLLFPIVAFAQEATEQDKENKEKIKEIKLSEDYVYADAVTEDNLSEAQQNSMDLLRANVNAILLNVSTYPKRMWKRFGYYRDKCQNVTIKKEDLIQIYLHHEGLSIPRKEEKEGEKRGVGKSETLKR